MSRALRLHAAALSFVLLSAPAAVAVPQSAVEAPMAEVSTGEGVTPDAAPVAALPPASADDPLLEGAPPEPTAEDLAALEETDPRFARPVLRRVARTAGEPSMRAKALLILARRDASRATARICARVLRIDPDAIVRRTAAECLGRLPRVYASAQTSALVAALNDENVDVVTMAGWALANVGEPEALGSVSGAVKHPDRRVGRLFLDYSDRLRTRHGLRWGAYYDEDEDGDPQFRVVPAPGRLIAQVGGVEVTAATGWVALYGGMAGWLHGGLFVAAYGGTLWQNLSPLTAMGGAVAGMVAGGTYAFFRADDLVRAHTVVQLGTMGTMIGYGAGVLSGCPPASGLNVASWGLAGTVVGTGLGVALVETLNPTPGALALGATVAFGAGVGFGGLALSSRFSVGSTAGAAMLTGGLMGGLTTVAVAPYRIGLLPSIGATLGGVVLASVAGVTMGVYESIQLQQELEFPFTAGSGWAIAAGYAGGAIMGGVGALLLPESWDPLLGGWVELDPPSIAMLQNPRDPRNPLPVATFGGGW
jgi:hypothetical protein